MKFKNGDKVYITKVIEGTNHPDEEWYIEEKKRAYRFYSALAERPVFIVKVWHEDGRYPYHLVDGYGVAVACSADWSDEELISINEKTVMTNLKEKFSLLFKKEPQKSFTKAGITNNDDTLTSDGSQIFQAWLLKKFGEEFKTDVVDELLKEDAKD